MASTNGQASEWGSMAHKDHEASNWCIKSLAGAPDIICSFSDDPDAITFYDTRSGVRLLVFRCDSCPPNDAIGIHFAPDDCSCAFFTDKLDQLCVLDFSQTLST